MYVSVCVYVDDIWKSTMNKNSWTEIDIHTCNFIRSNINLFKLCMTKNPILKTCQSYSTIRPLNFHKKFVNFILVRKSIDKRDACIFQDALYKKYLCTLQIFEINEERSVCSNVWFFKNISCLLLMSLSSYCTEFVTRKRELHKI